MEWDTHKWLYVYGLSWMVRAFVTGQINEGFIHLGILTAIGLVDYNTP